MTLIEEDYSIEDLVDLGDIKVIRYKNLKDCDNYEDDHFEPTKNETETLYFK
jgi:hypothetical protein